jgi:hypothetical protein
MSLIIELKISNLNDWIIIQPLLKRLKIPFVQKQVEQGVDFPLEIIEDETIWSPYDSFDAAATLLQAIESNSKPN